MGASGPTRGLAPGCRELPVTSPKRGDLGLGTQEARHRGREAGSRELYEHAVPQWAARGQVAAREGADGRRPRAGTGSSQGDICIGRQSAT